MLKRGLGLFLVAGAIMVAAVACGGSSTPAQIPEPTATPTLAAFPTSGASVNPTPTPTEMTVAPTATQASQSGDPIVGKQLAESNGCTSCHSTNGTKIVGPTFKGLYGSSVTLSDGSTVTAADAYLRRAIVSPDAQIPKGFSKGIMPAGFGQKLSDSQIRDIIAYIKTLK